MKVLVTGGTGALGQQVVARLRDTGHRARILSRRPGSGDDWAQGDLASGLGLAEAVRGMDGIIHAGSATTNPMRYRQTDVLGTRRLLEQARVADVSHVVFVSIVGMEGVHYPYYKHKLAAEAVIREGIAPWSILRATQFHTLLELFLGLGAKLPRLAFVPFAWQFQPVDPGDVANRLVAAVTGAPAGLLPDFGGPEVRTFRSLADSWLKARGQRRRLVNLLVPTRFSRQWAAGRLLAPDHRDGQVTWEQYLETRYQRPAG
ncbi:MAG: SDR family oxidoreductase [Candidatus Dormibacteraeota bacterium]|nr:SDR family oxidoreductase [Candidatus Dormibacteraeota bacterium]